MLPLYALSHVILGSVCFESGESRAAPF
jgi:hypothetical protein